MGMVATHAKYLANQTLQGLKRRIKDEWNFVLVSAHDAVQGVDTDSGILSVPPCLRASVPLRILGHHGDSGTAHWRQRGPRLCESSRRRELGAYEASARVASVAEGRFRVT